MPLKMDNPLLEEMLHNVVQMAEIGTDLKARYTLAEKYIDHIKILFAHANQTFSTLQSTAKYTLQQAQNLLKALPLTTNIHPADFKYEKLLKEIEKQLSNLDDLSNLDFEQEKLDLLYQGKRKASDSRHKTSDNSLPPCGSTKSVKYDVDEKYPENWRKDSFIDLNNVVNLPPVPEDIFTSFPSGNKPKKSSSLSSLKSMRKVKLFLQRVETSDEEDINSDAEDVEFAHKGDSEEGSPKKFLGNIKEESQY